MKKNDFKEVKIVEVDEIKKRVKKAQEELEGLVLDKNMRKNKDLKLVSKKRRDIAQMLTVLRQKEMLANLEKNNEKGEVK